MDDVALTVLCLAGCVFAASAGSKLRDREAYRSFRAGLRQAELLPESLLPAAAAVLCAAEVGISGALFATAALIAAAVAGAIPLAAAALAAAAALTAVLAGGVGEVIRRGTQAPCACFGAGAGRPLGWVHLVRNLSLLAVICSGLVTVLLGQGHPPLAGALLAAGAGVLGALIFIRWEELADLFTPLPHSGTTQASGPARGRS